MAHTPGPGAGMTILERLRAATGPLKTSEANDLAYDAGYHGENYALMVAALRGGVDDVGSAIALVERLLPGWVVDDLSQAARFAGNPWGCALGFYDAADPRRNKVEKSWHEFPSAPLAILTALFAALEAKERT